MKILDLKDSHRYNLQFDVDGQFVKRTDNNLPVAKCKNLFKAKFNFIGDEWTGTKTALFAQGEYSKSAVLDDKDECVIPWEFFDTDKNMTIGKVSVSCGDLVTTNCATVKITKSGYQESDVSVPPSPDVYQQLIELAEDTKKIAQSVRDDADAGEFDGEEGYSPKVSLTEELDGVTVTVQNKDVLQSAKVKNGKDGKPGKDGDPGANGITPHIGENENWHIGGTDTGKPSRGPQGENATDKQVRTAVDAYMEENPVAITVDPTLAQEGQAADAKATGDKILQYAIKATASGESIVLTDSTEEKLLDFGMQGKTEQLTTEGKNLFDTDEFLKLPLEQFSNYGNARVLIITLKPNTAYTMHTDNTGSLTGEVDVSRSLYFTSVDDMMLDGNTTGVFKGHNITKTSDETGKLKIVLIDRKNAIPIVNKEKYVMLAEGSTALPYEPYTGGKPSPSVEYPQKIVSAGDDGQIDVKVTGKNLFDISKNKYKCDEEKICIPSKALAEINITEGIIFEEKTAYFLSWESYIITKPNSDWSPIFGVEYTDKAREEYYMHFYKNGTKTNANKTIKYVYIRNPWSVGTEINRIQIEKGTGRTEYEPFKLQTITFHLDRPLTKWDRIEKQDGVWGVAYKSKTVDDLSNLITGREIIYGNVGNKYFTIAIAGANFNYDKTKVFSEVGVNNGNYTPKINTGSFIIGINDTDTIETAKEHMHYKVIYETDSEEFVPLPEETQTVLNALHTNYPTTVITNSEDCEMEVEYVADTKNYIDNKISENVASVISQYQTNVANLLSLMPLSVQAGMVENDTNNILENVEEMKHE